MHSQFSGRYFPSGPGFITALCFAPQTRHSISPLDSSTTFITCSFFVMLPKSIRVGDKTMECCIGSGFTNRSTTIDTQNFIKNIFPCFFMNGYFMSYVQHLCGNSFTKYQQRVMHKKSVYRTLRMRGAYAAPTKIQGCSGVLNNPLHAMIFCDLLILSRG
jgi:hypothetical protein